MAGPSPAVAATRLAVRRWLRTSLAPQVRHPRVLVACSGGADSLALVAATAVEAPRQGLRVGAVVVDHGLQEGSGEVARRAARQCRELLGVGEAPVEVVPVSVPVGAEGPEAGARQARYAALAAAADRHGAAAVLVGHTRDDQAETVLLGLARGAGARSAAGMVSARPLVGAVPAAASGHPVLLGRPFLGRGTAPGVSREQTRRACLDLGLEVWDDPHNEDPRFARVRVRHALADLQALLGPGLVGNLARTADLLRADADALEEAARAAYRTWGDPPWPVEVVGTVPQAVRTRVWRRVALAAGSPGTDLSSEHLLAVDELVTRWRGQGPLHLPGGVRAGRDGDRVWLRAQA